jgi:hypothetical protein
VRQQSALHAPILTRIRIIRIIISILPCFALIALLCVWLDGSPELYIVPALDVAEAFALAAAFLLMSAYAVPVGGDREAFFAQLELIDKKGNSTGTGSLKWYKVSGLNFHHLPPANTVYRGYQFSLFNGSPSA